MFEVTGCDLKQSAAYKASSQELIAQARGAVGMQDSAAHPEPLASPGASHRKYGMNMAPSKASTNTTIGIPIIHLASVLKWFDIAGSH